MKIAWWAGFLGAGVAFSASLGACNGYSSLGEVPGGGGEAGTDDEVGGSMSMGAQGGQGRGGTRATGGANGMGATSGTGMGATAGTGMGAVGGTEMGMGAVGGGSEPVVCMTDADCPPPPPFCNMCVDGTSACIRPVCADNVCGFEQPSCPGEPEPTPCMTDDECPIPSCPAGVPCPVPVCSMGYCGYTLPAPEGPCDGRECGDSCMGPDGVAGRCSPSGECIDGAPECGAGIECESSADCTADIECADCGNGKCAGLGCMGFKCVLMCSSETMCSSDMDCPIVEDDVCHTGGYVCEGGFCARRLTTCTAPMR